MISERKFATEFASVWRSILPLSESFVRAMNAQRERYAPPHDASYSSEMGGYISELGFHLFIAHHKGEIKIPPTGRLRRDERFLEISNRVWSYIQKLPSHQVPPSVVPSDAEHRDGIALAVRLVKFFSKKGAGRPMQLQPRFEGCGIIDTCFGDVLSGETLWEIKNVERDFRATDFRQLLVYCALANAAAGPSIKRVGLLNARQGVFLHIPLEKLSLGMAGIPISDLLSNIVSWISTDRISR